MIGGPAIVPEREQAELHPYGEKTGRKTHADEPKAILAFKARRERGRSRITLFHASLHGLENVADRIGALFLEFDLGLGRHARGDVLFGDELIRRRPSELEILRRQLLEPLGSREIAPFRREELHRFPLLRDLGFGFGDLAFDPPRGVLERIEDESRNKRHDDETGIEKPQHGRRSRSTMGNPTASGSSGQGGATVRSAALSLAERARGFSLSSRASGSR